MLYVAWCRKKCVFSQKFRALSCFKTLSKPEKLHRVPLSFPLSVVSVVVEEVVEGCVVRCVLAPPL